jgi:prephenate dehydrogenase
MLPKRLKQIDQDLIQLLGERIAILAGDSTSPLLDERLDTTHLLNQAGVPDFVWKSVLTGCAAAITAADLRPVTRPRRITVIGGNGGMGRFFTRRFLKTGHQVQVLGRQDWPNAELLLRDAELVLICVPTPQAEDVIQAAATYVKPSAAFADIASIKTPIVQAMLQQHPGPVLGLHPMFGPSMPSLMAQTIVVCPGRRPEAFQWLLEWMDSQGATIVESTPEEHDRQMITIQALRHFSTLCLGVFLSDEGIDIKRSLAFSSPPFRLMLSLVSRLLAQDASLSLDIMLTSEQSRQLLQRFANTCKRLSYMITKQNQTGLSQEFTTASALFEPNLEQGLAESSCVIDSLCLFLAANQAEAQQISRRQGLTTITAS